jgi:DNA topoisomerase VI subunit B
MSLLYLSTCTLACLRRSCNALDYALLNSNCCLRIVLVTMQVGVFVSIVSTKIPFKGAGKEYVGDDVEEMVGAVKAAIQQCCAQLRVSGAA